MVVSYCVFYWFWFVACTGGACGVLLHGAAFLDGEVGRGVPLVVPFAGRADARVLPVVNFWLTT
jgi:hypothetical protein